MEYRPLGERGMQVSVVGLGTMTFGEQNSEAEGHAQLDCALDHGVNLIDTAELYAIPPRAETYGRTEQIIGSWLRRSGRRDKIILASKIAGPGEGWVDHIRDGRTRYHRRHIEEALAGSLRRLGTDYLDLYQLHWPERKTNFFGRLDFVPEEEEALTPMAETLAVLDGLVREGRIRAIGLSNETPWGVMKFLQLADQLGMARVVSVQNPYSLLNRSYEIGLAEVSHREGPGLLAYSPLGFGVLTGKYLGGARPEGARITRWPHYERYSNPRAVEATRAYVELARAHGLDPTQMALAFVHSRPFLTSTLVGATTLAQLQRNLESAELRLPPAVLEGIAAIHAENPNPAP